MSHPPRDTDDWAEAPAAGQGRVRGYIDIGTNSVRLVLVRFHAHRTVTVLSEQKEIVRLGEDEFTDGHLRRPAMARAILVCRRFAEMARAHGAESITAIATSATREANNREQFLRQLRRDAGLEVRTVSGLEEARLIYRGVASGLSLGAKTMLCIDIGGGSTELAVGDATSHTFLDSLKLGAVRLATQFGAPDQNAPMSSADYELIKRYVVNRAIRSLQRLREMPVDLVIGSSGTVENLADIAARRFAGRSRSRGDTLSLAHLQEITAELRQMTVAQRRRVPGINPSRADIIIHGAVILDALMSELDIGELIVSGRGLREGLIQDDLDQLFPSMRGMTVRERSVLELARRCGVDETHARTVQRLSLELFDQTAELGLHRLGPSAREALEHAAFLHDVGAFVSYSNHQVHSYYIIRHADLLGFDENEVALIAAVARFHRRGSPSKKHPEYAVLPKRGRKEVRVLAALLRLAEALDRTHAGAVRTVHVAAAADAVTIAVGSAGPFELEMWGAQAQAKAFRRAFGRSLLVAHESELDPLMSAEGSTADEAPLLMPTAPWRSSANEGDAP